MIILMQKYIILMQKIILIKENINNIYINNINKITNIINNIKYHNKNIFLYKFLVMKFILVYIHNCLNYFHFEMYLTLIKSKIFDLP